MSQDEQDEVPPAVKVLGKGDHRFVCIECKAEEIVRAPTSLAMANEWLGACGWRIFVRSAAGVVLSAKTVTGLRCPACSFLRMAEDAQVEAAAVAAEAAAA